MELLKALMIIFQAVSSSCSDTQICTILHLKYSCHSFHFHVEVSVRSHEKPCLLPYPKRSSSENTSLTCYFFPQKFLILFICLDEKNISSMKGETGEEEMGEHLPKVGREGSPIPAAAAVCCLVWPLAAQGLHRQAPLSMGFPKQDYRRGLLFPTPGDLLNPGIEPVSPALSGRSLLLHHLGSPYTPELCSN